MRSKEWGYDLHLFWKKPEVEYEQNKNCCNDVCHGISGWSIGTGTDSERGMRNV